MDDGRPSATVDFGIRCTPIEERRGLWICVTQFYSGPISENVLKKKQKKIFSNETLFSQPIFVVLGRELLLKFSIVTKKFSIGKEKIWRGWGRLHLGAPRRPHLEFERTSHAIIG